MFVKLLPQCFPDTTLKSNICSNIGKSCRLCTGIQYFFSCLIFDMNRLALGYDLICEGTRDHN